MTYKPSAIAFAITAIALVSGPTAAQEPYAPPDDSWISISGTVAMPTEDSFILDYGDGVITVEMDDWDNYGDAYGLMEGKDVTVHGRIDDDLYEIRTIEAGSVYVDDLNTYFYANAADEEGGIDLTEPWAMGPSVAAQTTMRGTVTAVSPEEGEFTLSLGDIEMQVETEGLTYNPLDDTGYQQVDIGDRVSVTGLIDNGFLVDRVLDADLVITLQDDDSQS